MKVYDYECKECKFRFEDMVVKTIDDIVNCSICHKPMDRLPAAPIFKLNGDCWYKDGYTRSKKDEA